MAFQIFYIPLHADTHSAHAELMLSFSKREIVETRTWEGIGVVTYKAFTWRFVLDGLKLRKLHE